MYVCHHCGYISRNENMNYCNNVNCKYYGHNTTTEHKMSGIKTDEMPQKRSLMRADLMTFNYDGDINYPSDRQTGNMANMTNMNNMANMNNMPNNYMRNEMQGEYMRNEMQNDYKMSDSCGELAFATVPMQKLEKLYSPKEAMRAGTIFPSLNMPYDKKIIRRG